MKIYRHGDLSFRSIEKVEGEEIKQNGSFVLALGEHTNHKHTITAPRETMKIFKDAQGRYILEIKETAILTHEEHKPLEITPGIYRMENQREFNYFANSTQRVQD